MPKPSVTTRRHFLALASGLLLLHFGAPVRMKLRDLLKQKFGSIKTALDQGVTPEVQEPEPTHGFPNEKWITIRFTATEYSLRLRVPPHGVA